jgi:arylsulfatase A-like enzyme
MFTGRLPFEHRAGTMGRSRLDGRYPTIAESLSRRGYATCGFIANTFWAARHTGLNRGFMCYRDHYGTVGDALTRTALGRRVAYEVLPSFGFVDVPGRKRAGAVNAEALGWIDSIGDRPFLAFLNYFDVHSPLLPPAPFAGTYSGLSPAQQREHAIAIKDLDGAHAPPRPEELKRMIDAYDESIRYLDHEIGSLLDSLERRNRLKNTLVIITSDHGESWGEHGLMFHGQSLYRELTRVPLIIRDPKATSAVRRNDAVGLDQLPATIAAYTGADASAFPGPSLLADSGARDATVLQLPRRNVKETAQPASRSSLAGLATGRWHYIESASGSELFDIAADPRGLRDLSTAPSLTDTVRGLRDRMRVLQRSRVDLR